MENIHEKTIVSCHDRDNVLNARALNGNVEDLHRALGIDEKYQPQAALCSITRYQLVKDVKKYKKIFHFSLACKRQCREINVCYKWVDE